ncbi:transposable element Tcb2 transposase [Trichonephila clavipes]|nr:transposable element Tcb2 transposase [Trichonephila clavipes]
MAKSNRLDDFPRGRMIGKLEEGRSLTNEAKEFGINKSVISRAWTSLLNHRYSVRKIGGGRPRKTTEADDRYIVLQAKRTRCQSEKRNCSAIVQQQGNKTHGLFWPDAFTKVAYSPAVNPFESWQSELYEHF